MSGRTAMSGKTAMSKKTAMSERTAMSEDTAMSERTAMSEDTAMSERTAADDNVMSDAALIISRAFVLDCWHVYPTRNLIQYRGAGCEERQLEPRLMRLLCLLAASADAVVARDDIISVLWPRVVVNENSLTRAVSDLRHALTPAGVKRTSLIQTIPKRGYRLTQAPADLNTLRRPAQTAKVRELDHGQTLATKSRVTATRRWIERWTPSIAACFILALALVLRVSDSEPSSSLVAKLPVDSSLATGDGTTIYDRFAGSTGLPPAKTRLNAETLTTSLLEESQARHHITPLGTAPFHGFAMPAPSMLTPDGQLLAFVDYHDGISSLNLRPTLTGADPWVAFTTDERIFDLQWSPLDAGILMSVSQTAAGKEQSSYLRLMLLDLETLTMHELYRRELPAEPVWARDTGSLT